MELTNFTVSIIVPIMLERITFGTYLVFLAFLILGVGERARYALLMTSG